MTTESEVKFKEPDYKAIRKLSHSINCIIYESDFNTDFPNRWADRTMIEIQQYLKYRGGVIL